MKILIDTHYLIWILNNEKCIPHSIREILEADDTEVFASAVNFWEISLKAALGKIDLKGHTVSEIYRTALKSNIGFINLTPDESISFSNLPVIAEHKDPFDRMLVWQAIKNDFYFLTADSKIVNNYAKFELKILK
ncbi:MAG: type II toxin-antitoxin system VapC family toxin [Fibrobacteres bacterium]|nr:type II toxin-antitoxin system VapC family toxin [Fibrobacterota bacterium]